MTIRKLIVNTRGAMPVIAALPYALAFSGDTGGGGGFAYNPNSQLSEFSASRDFSTCREDESVSSFFKTKSDTQKDD
ncbi:MAG TPA: hypothetical protein VHE81_17400 [Lacipirellulaceae bacterium]|nr:hypothetical protein [Lacipirellulaceae bacterium]